jgi:hypothetical protein
MTVPQIDPLEISKWQGGVDEKLVNLNGRMGNLETKVDALPERIEKRIEKIFNNKNERRITFQWVMEKVALPLLLSGGSAGLAVYVIMKSIGG